MEGAGKILGLTTSNPRDSAFHHLNGGLLLLYNMAAMYLQIKTAELVPDKFGQHIKITKVGLYDENGKWIKWVKLNDALLNKLLKASYVVDL